MKHLRKTKIQTVLLLLMVLCFVPSMALADDAQSMKVQLNGENVMFTDAVPVNENGRVYVPFRAVFEALDAEVDYRAEDGRIMAEKDGVQVTFYVNQNTVTVDSGMENIIEIDAPPFIRDGRTYVPVRFAAQTLGLEVGWDGSVSTVVMLDKDELKENAKGQYKLMDSYLKYAKAQNLTGNVKTEGSLKLDMQMADGSGEAAKMIPLTGSLKLNGITSPDQADMDIAMELNLEELQAALLKNDAMTDDNLAAMDALKQMHMQVLVDNKTGTAYMQSDIFAQSGMDGSAWYKMNLNDAQSGMNLQAIAAASANSQNGYEASVMQMIDSLMPENASACEIMLKSLNMYRDDAFQRVGNQYISSTRYDSNGSATSMSITLKTNGSTITGYQQATSVYMGTAPIMTMKLDMTGSKASVDMNMNVQGILTMKVSGDVRYSAASEKPQALPPYGAVILDMSQSAV